MKLLKVKLASVGNVDYEEIDYRGHLEIAPKWVPVETLWDASKTCREFIEKNSLGGGNWTGGLVINENKQPVGYISYNGRIWSPEEAKSWGHFLEVTDYVEETTFAELYGEEVESLWNQIQTKAQTLGVEGYSRIVIMPGTKAVAVKAKLMEILETLGAIERESGSHS